MHKTAQRTLLLLLTMVLFAGTLFAAHVTQVQAKEVTIDGATNLADVNLQDGDTLILNGGVTYTLPSDIRLTKIIVSGQGNTLQGPEGSPVALNGCSENNGITVQSGAELTLENVKLSGAWVYNNGTVTATNIDANNCVFKNNGATLSISDSVLHDSYRFTAGGTHETMIHGSGATITIANTELANNKNDSGGEGGSIISILNGSNLTLDNVTGRNNTTRVWGGLIYANNSEVHVANSNFANNQSTNANGGGVICQVGGSLDIASTTFTDNSTAGKGGAIFLNGTTLTIDSGTTFEGNSATVAGGAIYLINGAYATVGAAAFNQNGSIWQNDDWNSSANRLTRNGGAIYVDNSALTLNGTKFQANEVAHWETSSGGAVFAIGGNTSVAVNGAKFVGNYATTYGGAMTVANDATATILDLNGDPTEFTDNLVEWGRDFAGGALFINVAYVKMEDAAIYDNTADEAGGGLSTCTTGTAQVRVLDGSAIFNNHVINADVDAEILDYQDIYFQTRDHIDQDTGSIIPGRDGFQDYPYELYERMFNGGLHKWSTKELLQSNDEGNQVRSLIASSSPTNEDISNAKVIFTRNVAQGHPALNIPVSGGAIGCNGLLEIGTSVEIKLLKVWDDDNNDDGYRPTKEEYRDLIKQGNLTIRDQDGNAVDLTNEAIQVDVVEATEYDLANNVAAGAEDTKALEEIVDDNTYLIIISGLEPGEYRVISDTVDKYTSDLYYASAEAVEPLARVLKNTHEPEKVLIKGTKVWDDEDDKDGVRPSTITIRLFDPEDQELASVEVTPDKDGNWSFVFEDLDLPRYIHGEEIQYRIAEDSVDNYELVSIEEAPAEDEAASEKSSDSYTNRKDYADISDEELDNDKIEELDTPAINENVVPKEYVITNKHTPETPEEDTVVPPSPSTTTPSSVASAYTPPKTGDPTNIWIWEILLIASAMCCIGAIRIKKKCPRRH